MARSTKIRLWAIRKLAMAMARRRQSKRRPNLSDVLSGEVIKQVMKADQAAREDVEDLMEQAHRSRDKS